MSPDLDTQREIARLREERRLLETVLRLSPVGILMLEAASERIIVANREAERILGPSHHGDNTLASTLDDVQGNGLPSLAANHPARRALERGEVVRAEEFVHERPDGWAVPTLVSAAPVYGEQGDITGAVATVLDVSPREELERLKSEFLGIVCHQLRTPLTTIKGAAATVLGRTDGFDEGEAREFFRMVDEQADRMRELVNSLLDMTRIEVGALPVSPDPYDLRESLAAARDTYLRRGGGQPILIEQPDGPVMVNADRRRIDQALNILLGNAGRFSPEDAPITVRATKDDDFVLVEVLDQGRGLGQQALPHVFKKFFRAHSEGGDGLEGRGLGLDLCKGIVEAHGGRIWATSPGEGRGSSFCFTLPRAPQQETGQGAKVCRGAEHLGRVAQGGKRARVLAVDPEPQVLRHLQGILRHAGYHPIVTGDPAEVMGLLEQEEPQAVLLDLDLPGVNGFKALEQIRQVSGAPALILTARDSEEDIVRALRLGADDYVIKPFSPYELLARIEACMRRRVLPDQIEVRPSLAINGLVIDYGARHVTVAGREVKLTATEYKLLYELSINSGKALTYDQILRRVWGTGYAGEGHLVRSIVRNLRRKLGDDARCPRFIHTVPSVGYRMAGPFFPGN